jgi:hypothetical protein
MTVVAHPRSMAELLSNKYAHFDQEQILIVSILFCLPNTFNVTSSQKFILNTNKFHNFEARAQCYKPFLSVIYEFLYYDSVFVPGKLFQLSLTNNLALYKTDRKVL